MANQPKRKPEAPKTATNVTPLAAVHCDRFSVTITERGVFLSLFSEGIADMSGGLRPVLAFTGALSHADAQSLAKTLQASETARLNLASGAAAGKQR